MVELKTTNEASLNSKALPWCNSSQYFLTGDSLWTDSCRHNVPVNVSRIKNTPTPQWITAKKSLRRIWLVLLLESSNLATGRHPRAAHLRRILCRDERRLASGFVNEATRANVTIAIQLSPNSPLAASMPGEITKIETK